MSGPLGWGAVGVGIISTAVAVASIAVPVAAVAERASQPFLLRVLTMAERTSVVLELDEPPLDVRLDRGDASSVVVEVGPIRQPTSPRELKPGADVPLLLAVSVREVDISAAQRRLQLRLRVKTGAQATVRAAGKRVYVDLSSPARAVAPGLAGSSGPAGPRSTPAAAVPVSRSALARSAPARPATAAPERPQDVPIERRATAVDVSSLGYANLAALVAGAAATLSKKPDINALVELRARVVKRDDELGHGAPDVILRVLADLDQRLDDARRLRLKLDAQEFERAGRSSRK
jgi:hypothetical protein